MNGNAGDSVKRIELKTKMKRCLLFIFVAFSASGLVSCFGQYYIKCDCDLADDSGTFHWRIDASCNQMSFSDQYDRCTSSSEYGSCSKLIGVSCRKQKSELTPSGEQGPGLVKVKFETFLSPEHPPLQSPWRRQVNLPEGLQCAAECANPDSYLCQLVPESGADSLNKSIDRLAMRILEGRSVIKKSDIMGDFDVSEDPCERTDTFLADGVISNSGKACTFKTSVNIGGTQLAAASLFMPELIEGDIRVSQDNSISIDFGTPERTGFLTLEGYWDADFGGRIRTIDYVAGAMVLGTERGCLKFE